MKEKLYVLVAVALVAFVACQQPQAPTVISNVNTNTNNNGGGGLTDPNAAATQCLPSEDVPIRVDLTVPTSAALNQNTPIDATPKSAAGKRSDGCNILQGIFWTASPADVCSVPNPSEFNTVMRCAKAGNCTLTATVPGRGASGSAVIVCQ